MVLLTESEQYLFDWLRQEDYSQYGECHGKDLDRLIELGLAQIHGEESGLGNTFIAKGRGLMYRAVSLTEEGIQMAKERNNELETGSGSRSKR